MGCPLFFLPQHNWRLIKSVDSVMTKSRTIREYLQSIPPENTATRVSFFLAGFMMAIWAAMVPFVKARLSLDEAHLGTLLLCVGLGALFVMPFCGGIIARRGVGFLLKKAYFFAALLLCVVYFSENLFLTAAILFLFGMIFGSIDVSMNVHAVEVDQRSPKRLIAGFHALYSFGNVAGALGMAALLNVDISVWMAVAALLALGLLLWLLVSRHLLSDAGCSTEKTPAFAVPKGFVLLLGLICFVLFMVEGAVLDWGGVFLIQEKSVAIENAGLAFASFATAMTVMRLFGDRLITLAGPRYCVHFGALLASLALIGTLVFQNVYAVIAAFFLLGLGLANLVPIAFASTANQTLMPMSMALAAVTTLGYGGQLLGPAFIGYVAKATDLTVAFALLAALMVIVALSFVIFRRK